MEITQEALYFVRDNYKKKFGTLDTFDENLKLYMQLPKFKANQNIHEVLTDYSKKDSLIDSESEYLDKDSLDAEYKDTNGNIKAEIHWIMRMFTMYHLTEAFDAMKIDLEDPNIAVNALGKGTPGRIAKMWCGNDPEDDSELLSGRWNKEPALSRFPNDGSVTETGEPTDGEKGDIVNTPVTKEVDVVAVCSHHFLPFSTYDGGRAIISYIPGKYVIGISKLQRFVNWEARRGWLQESLTTRLGKTISRIAETNDVYVRIEKAVHGCEKFRGVQSKNGNLTTEYVSGWYKDHKIV